MGAEHVRDDAQDRDEMHRAGLVVILEEDAAGVGIVKVSSGAGGYMSIRVNDAIIFEHVPDDEKRIELIEAKQEAAASRSKADRVKDEASKYGIELPDVVAEAISDIVAAADDAATVRGPKPRTP